MAVTTTLSFLGRTEEALSFYRTSLGCETIYLMRFHESPDQSLVTVGSEELIFHATFRICGTEFMASDIGHDAVDAGPSFSGFALALRPESIELGRKMFDALSDQGEVLIPLAESLFTQWYGIVKDRFGITWKINIPR